MPKSTMPLPGKVAAQCAVLLKNEAGFLPLKKETRFALIGELAARPRYQGSGSSLVNPTRVESALDCCRQRGLNFAYCPGYSVHTDQSDDRLVEEACRAAAGADVAVVFAGLTDIYESEGFDREYMKLPANQNWLIERLARQPEPGCGSWRRTGRCPADRLRPS